MLSKAIFRWFHEEQMFAAVWLRVRGPVSHGHGHSGLHKCLWSGIKPAMAAYTNGLLGHGGWQQGAQGNLPGAGHSQGVCSTPGIKGIFLFPCCVDLASLNFALP